MKNIYFLWPFYMFRVTEHDTDIAKIVLGFVAKNRVS